MPPWDALIVATIFRLPLVVAIVNLADELPERIVTVAGTLARNGWLLDKFTTIPPDGATALSVTVPIEEAPPATMVGLSVKAARTADDCIACPRNEQSMALVSPHLCCFGKKEKKPAFANSKHWLSG